MERSLLKYFSITVLIILSIVAITNFIIDPLQFYRRNLNHQLCGNDRWQVACFIKNFQFNTVVIGTSMTQNFSTNYINKKMGLDSIKLSIAGASIQEQLIVLRHAVKSKKLKTVIWGLDRHYFYSSKKRVDIPLFMYDQSYDSHLKYLLNMDSLAQSIRLLAGKKDPTLSNVDTYNNWGDKEVFSEQKVKDLYNNLVSKKQKKLSTKKC